MDKLRLDSGLLLAGLVIVSGCQRAFLERKSHNDPSRAGRPDEIHSFAISQEGENNIGNQIGGGAPALLARNVRKSEAPTQDEGTWGWDYAGRWFPSRVALNWWHGRKHQGGEGAYKIDHKDNGFPPPPVGMP